MSKTNLYLSLSIPGLPHHATLGPATAYYASPVDSGGPHSPSKYHENGHDTFSDFVTLVCQEAQSTNVSQPGGSQLHSRSPLNVSANSHGKQVNTKLLQFRLEQSVRLHA